MTELDAGTAQRLGSGHGVPPQELDQESWKKVTRRDQRKDLPGGRSHSKHHDDSDLLTLSQVFSRLRLGDGALLQVGVLTPFVWKCLRNLREPADTYGLQNPRRFREKDHNYKLNWYQAAEKETATIRAICGHPAKRTSRAAAWRAVAASMRQTLGASELGDLAPGMVAMFAPVGVSQWRLGFILSVWRGAAKAGCCKPTALPIPCEAAKCFRVCELTAVPNTREGVMGASADSQTVVCPAYRSG